MGWGGVLWYLLVATWMMVARLAPSLVNANMLYFSTPGDDTHSPGFYGAKINSSATSGAHSHLFKYGYSCFTHNNEYHTELDLKSISVDPVSKDALLAVYDQQKPDRLTLLTGPACEMPPSCTNYTMKGLFYKRQMTYHKVGPFAYYNSTIYFLLHKKERLDSQRTRDSIQLRRMSGCEDLYPVSSSSDFQLESCSILEATLNSEDHSNNQSPLFSTLDNLVAIEAPGTNQPSFLTSLLMTTEIPYGLEVELVYISSQRNAVKLNSRPVATDFLKYDLRQLGGISLKDGKVCWSAIDTIQCADWDPLDGGVTSVKTALRKGMAKAACKADSPGQDILAEVVTGVAIARAKDHDDMAIYFGCLYQPESLGFGGAGLLIRSYEAKIHRITSDKVNVNAGAMIATDMCDKTSGSSPCRAIALGTILTFVCAIKSLI